MILCTPPFFQTNLIFLSFFLLTVGNQLQLQRAGLLDALSDLVEITFIDAPNPASGPIPEDVAPHFSPPYYEWWNAQRTTTTTTTNGSTTTPTTTWTYQNASTSLSFLTDYMKLHGPFDGLMGFSQGGLELECS